MGDVSPFNPRELGLKVTVGDMLQIAAAFGETMNAGLANEPSSLKMLPSFLRKPSGTECGEFLAVDFGGTNIRVQKVHLAGQGRWEIKDSQAVPLKNLVAGYDVTAATADAMELFDFVANQIGKLAEINTPYYLGHTFSFPCHQHGIHQAELISWTKEIKTAGVEGQDIGQLLTSALKRRGLNHITPCAIINDTVGTLLTGAYVDTKTDIGAICGTGHNTCYYDSVRDTIINMESGNFDLLPMNAYDFQLDATSDNPKTQRLEKMVAGYYLGELVRLVGKEFMSLPAIPYALTSEDVARIISGEISRHPEIAALEPRELVVLKEIGTCMVERSLKLVTASFLGVLGRIDPKLKRPHTIVIDGSLYEKMPGYASGLVASLKEVLGNQGDKLTIKLSKDGSGVGAAIAAAIVAGAQE